LVSGEYRVALADDNTVDLFPSAGVISPAPAPPAPAAPTELAAPPPPPVASDKTVILAAKPIVPDSATKEPAAPPPPPVFSDKKVSLAAIPMLPGFGTGAKAVRAKPLPPHFKISAPVAAIGTQEKSPPSDTKETEL
jgi:hypothetical protein